MISLSIQIVSLGIFWCCSLDFITAYKDASATSSEGSEVYVDLAYLPSGCASSTVDPEFFRRLRSLHYIVSGDDPVKVVAMRSILDALLEGKASWPEVQVSKNNSNIDLLLTVCSLIALFS